MTTATDLVTTYLRRLEAFETDPAAFADLLHPDFEQTEYPNALNPRGQRSDHADAMRRLGLAPKILATQAYELRGLVEAGDRVVAEVGWTGTMAVDAGPLKAGQQLTADLCMVYELRDGRIRRQRNYDCFAPFA